MASAAFLSDRKGQTDVLNKRLVYLIVLAALIILFFIIVYSRIKAGLG